MDPEFWKGKRVLVTGHTGFKGSWLCLWLQELGAVVIGYALQPPTTPSLFNLADVAHRMKSNIADVCDLENLKLCILENSPDIIIHMAAQSLVRISYDEPVDTYATNVMGTVNVLEAIRKSECVKVAIIVTSDKCYDNKEWHWAYRENDPMGGYDPYSSSKGCAELITSAYRSSYFKDERDTQHGVGIASVRAGNVIGGGDWAEGRLIPDILNAFISKKTAIIRNPNAVRPWQYVLEPLNGYLTLAELLWVDETAFAEGWNFGPNEEDIWSVFLIADRLAQLWGSGVGWKHDPSPKPHEAKFLKLDCSKAKATLNWSPKLSLDVALEWTVEWYRNYQEKKDMHQVTMNQIHRYQERILS